MKHKYEDMFLSILDNDMIEDFYKSKMKFNPTPPPTPVVYKCFCNDGLRTLTLKHY